MTLPNFLVIGSPKCATTAICRHLDAHPEICFSKPKEPFYFCWEKFFKRGVGWYESCFEHAAGEPAVGEGTTHYALVETYPMVIDRIRELLGEPKIVFCVRHPFERMQSEWVELRSQGLTMKPFADDLRSNGWYIDGSMYCRTLDAYAEAFGERNVHCVIYDDFKADAAASMSTMFGFLGVDTAFMPRGLDVKVYGSAGKREDRPLVNFLRRSVPGFDALRNASPGKFRSMAKKYLKKPIEGHPEWDDESRSWARERVADNVRAFLRRVGREDLEASWLGGTA
ncbi:MAG: sulfotransferase [Planctomycetota bacterium]